MALKRSESIDYTSQCTVCIDYEDGGTTNRLVYERPQIQMPDGPLTELDRVRLSQYPNDEVLTEEARAIFSDMQDKGRIGQQAVLGSIFIARSAAAALEMDL